MPERLEPMLARTGTLPRDDGEWAYEIKWDGVRAIGYVDGGAAAAREPQRQRHHAPLPGAARARAGARLARGDPRRRGGRVRRRPPVVPEAPGPHAPDLRARGAAARRSPTRSIYMIFDLLWLEGHSLMELPYEERRAQLAELGLSGPTWQTPAHHVGDGAGLLEASRAQGLEGIIAKRLDCPYAPGRRSQRLGEGQERPQRRRRRRRLAAGQGAAAPAASARSWSASTRTASCATPGASAAGSARPSSRALGTLLDGLAREDSPFTGRQPPKETRFVEPRLVCVGRLLRGHQREDAAPALATRACATTSRRRTSGRPTRSSSRSRRCSW